MRPDSSHYMYHYINHLIIYCCDAKQLRSPCNWIELCERM